MPRTTLPALVAVALSLIPSAPAGAGSYTVHACGSDGINRAFWAYANPGLTAGAGCPGVDYHGLTTGLFTRADRGAGGGRLGLHASAWQILEAPPGTALQSMTLGLSAGRSHGCWSQGVWAWNGDAFHPGEHLWGYGSDCGVTGSGFTWFAGPYSIDLRGYEKVRVGVRCDSGSGCRTDETATWTSAKDVAVTIRDDSAPAIAFKHGALLGDGWHRGSEWAWAGYADNVGIRRIYGEVSGYRFASQDFAAAGWPPHVTCDFTRPRPCADIPDGGLGLDTTIVADGPHALRIVAVDAAGNTAAHERAIRVDNHAPAAPRGVTVAGGEGWRRANGFGVSWENPPGQVAPIGRAHWRLCRAAGPPDCRTGMQAGRDIAAIGGLDVPEAGDWTLAVWLADEAGNVDGAHVADPVHLRLDDVAPETPGFDRAEPADPRRVALPVADRHSGVAAVSIELRGRGQTDWRALATGLEPDGRAAAHVPDAELPDGVYELRSVVRDHAGNEATAGADRTGRPMTVVVPLRQGTRFVARHSAARRCRTVRRRRVCRSVDSAPSASSVREPLRVAFGRAATLTGVLETWQDRPVTGAPVEVWERARTEAAWRAAATVTTDGAGGFSLRVAPGPSRTLRVAYAGGDLLLPAALEARVLVPASGALSVSRRRTRNGGRVVFTGRLRGRPLPLGGRTVDLQAHYRGAWRTFATPRTDARGRWRQPYRFGATRGRVVYRFRAAIKRDAGYPYEHGVTRTVKVTVTS
jgi:hypothetical protein